MGSLRRRLRPHHRPRALRSLRPRRRDHEAPGLHGWERNRERPEFAGQGRRSQEGSDVRRDCLHRPNLRPPGALVRKPGLPSWKANAQWPGGTDFRSVRVFAGRVPRVSGGASGQIGNLPHLFTGFAKSPSAPWPAPASGRDRARRKEPSRRAADDNPRPDSLADNLHAAIFRIASAKSVQDARDLKSRRRHLLQSR